MVRVPQGTNVVTPDQNLDAAWLDLAAMLSQSAQCRKRKVGAVLVDTARGIQVGYGVNHDPTGNNNCLQGDCPRAFTNTPMNSGDYDNCIAIHAEARAILDAGNLSCGATMYCTSGPCAGCRKLIISAGVARFVSLHGEVALR